MRVDTDSYAVTGGMMRALVCQIAVSMRSVLGSHGGRNDWMHRHAEPHRGGGDALQRQRHCQQQWHEDAQQTKHA